MLSRACSPLQSSRPTAGAHWKELQPTDSAGVFGITSIVVTPDGTSDAFTFSSSLGSLYLAEGIK